MVRAVEVWGVLERLQGRDFIWMAQRRVVKRKKSFPRRKAELGKALTTKGGRLVSKPQQAQGGNSSKNSIVSESFREKDPGPVSIKEKGDQRSNL